MSRLAFYTFGILNEAWPHPATNDFLDAAPDVFHAAETTPGFIARALRPDRAKSYFGQNFGPFGDFAVPRFYTFGTELADLRLAVTLSLWTGIAPVRGFSYGGPHKDALVKRTDWFAKPDHHSFAMWWVGDDETPTWRDASDRLEYLHDHGPSPRAFKFSSAFDANGKRIAP